MPFEIVALGDAALIVRVGASLGKVLQTLQKLEAAELTGVAEVAPAPDSVAVFFTAPPDFESIAEEIQTVLRSKARGREKTPKPRKIVVPVCYDPVFGPDLELVAQHCGLSPEEIGQRHAAARYRVQCLGFTPGFPYLSGLPPKLATPRRVTPRTAVPAGSVAIGGAQTGIYPLPSPGGWNIIGRTPLQFFDVTRAPASLLRAGDEVRFASISRGEFERWAK